MLFKDCGRADGRTYGRRRRRRRTVSDHKSSPWAIGSGELKMCFSKRGILWRFVIKIYLIKRSTEEIGTQWQDFLQDPRIQLYWKISPPKSESFQIKILIFFIFLLETDFWYSLLPPRQRGSNEYLQSMFFRRNMKNNVYPCKPMKKGLKGSIL